MPVPAPRTGQASHDRAGKTNPTRPLGNGSNAGNNDAGPSPTNVPTKNVKRKSSKPIIDWLQRKLAGTVRVRRVSTGMTGRPPLPNGTVAGNTIPGTNGNGNINGAVSVKSARTGTSVGGAFAVDENGFVRARPSLQRPLSNEMSLRSGVDSVMDNDNEDDDDDDDSERRSSGAGVSTWSRSRSNRMNAEADEDASIRPLPPTSPPSPSPSRSSSSYLSDPRTFKSMSASTKPTTLLSIDITNGMAHIAQAPPTPNAGYAPPSPVHHGPRFQPHARTSSGGASGTQITFSALPPYQVSSSRPSSLNPIRPSALQAPQHTAHHPRNNPRPSSPPLDNASVLTLASSAFAQPTNAVSRGAGAYAWSARAEADSVSQLGGADSVSHASIVADDATLELDRDASMRALRPRSSRRGSWESEASRWSAAVSGNTGTGGLSALGRGGSVRTAPSFRTGGQTGEDQDGCFSLIDEDPDSDGDSRRGHDDERDGRGLSPNHAAMERQIERDEARSPISVNLEHPTLEPPSSPTSPSHERTLSQTSSSGEEPTRPTTPDDQRTQSSGQDTTPKKERLKELEDVGSESPIRFSADGISTKA